MVQAPLCDSLSKAGLLGQILQLKVGGPNFGPVRYSVIYHISRKRLHYIAAGKTK